MNIAKRNRICYNASRQKSDCKSIWTKNESPNRVTAQSGDSSFLFMVAKHPPGYLLPLSCLSSHLPMRWQTTPAATVTRKVMMISIWTPPPIVGCRLDNIGIIPYQWLFFSFVLIWFHTSAFLSENHKPFLLFPFCFVDICILRFFSIFINKSE